MQVALEPPGPYGTTELHNGRRATELKTPAPPTGAGRRSMCQHVIFIAGAGAVLRSVSDTSQRAKGQ